MKKVIEPSFEEYPIIEICFEDAVLSLCGCIEITHNGFSIIQPTYIPSLINPNNKFKITIKHNQDYKKIYFLGEYTFDGFVQYEEHGEIVRSKYNKYSFLKING